MTRRTFLKDSTKSLLAGGLSSAGLRAVWGQDPPAANSGSTAPHVVRYSYPEVIRGGVVHPRILLEMIERVIAELTGLGTVQAAWEKLLGPGSKVAVKFNSSAASRIGTSTQFAEALLTSLLSAGWTKARLLFVEFPEDVAGRLGIRVYQAQWEPSETDFGSGRDNFCTLPGEVDAIINVPFIKTHNIAGLTCSLKNISHSMVKHPARFHANGCSPYVADIWSVPPLRNKVKLNLVDGLRIVWDGGPEAYPDYMEDAGYVLVGVDPVAVDCVSIETLDRVRMRHGIETLLRSHGPIQYLAAASEKGLGTNQLHLVKIADLKD